MPATRLLERPLTAPAAHAPKAITNVLVLSAVAVLAIAAFVLIGLDGWSYYRIPAAVRGYDKAHRVLRPAGRVGHLFGVGGFVLMLVPVAYAIRKKARALRNAGRMKTWLDVHIFCGIVGPVLVTFHTSFKFNGIVSVAYWSMVAVVLSGFVGRYLYVRIPRSLRGLELTQAELDGRALALSDRIAAAALPERTLSAIDSFEQRVLPHDHPSYGALFFGDFRMRREIARFHRIVDRQDLAPIQHDDVIVLASERATLLRRMAFLEKTRRLFELWHVFHLPLVYVMFAIVTVHVAVTMYMGYIPFLD